MAVEVEVSTRQQQCFAGDVVEGTVNLNVSTVSWRTNKADREVVARGAPVDEKMYYNKCTIRKYDYRSNTYGIVDTYYSIVSYHTSKYDRYHSII